MYSQDTNTNVCPSLHVVGSMAVCFAAWNCRRLRKPWIQGAIWAFAFLVAVSTVFVKQHSALDIILAVPFSLVVYPVVYRLIFRRSGVESPCETFCQRACDLTAGSLWRVACSVSRHVSAKPDQFSGGTNSPGQFATGQPLPPVRPGGRTLRRL